MMKYVIISIAFLLGINLYSQNTVNYNFTGTYNTTFGTLKLVGEYNSLNTDVPWEYERLYVYGDYRTSLGTISSTKVEKTYVGGIIVKGKFTNGSKWGSFEWTFYPSSPNNTYSDFKGKWGWNDKLNGGEWNGTKKNRQIPKCLNMNIWGGEWDTRYGKIFLNQDGNKVTGTYRDLGNIEGHWNGKRLLGTFTNNGTKGTFIFFKDQNNPNNFFGHWEWGNKPESFLIRKMFTSDNVLIPNQKNSWSGTKVVKTNCKKKSETFKTGKYEVYFTSIYVRETGTVLTEVNKTWEFYGKIHVKLFTKRNNGSEIPEIDNKSITVWDKNENNTVPIRQIQNRPYDDYRVKNHETGKWFTYQGKSFILDRERRYNIPQNLVNNNITLGIQINLSEDDAPYSDDRFSWKHHLIDFKSLELNKEYLIIRQEDNDSNFKIAVGFKVTKID